MSIKTTPSELQTITNVSDFEQFGPASCASEENINDLIDVHCMLTSESDYQKLSVKKMKVTEALKLLENWRFEQNPHDEPILTCPIDHSGNSKVENTLLQSWNIYSPTWLDCILAINNSGCYIITKE